MCSSSNDVVLKKRAVITGVNHAKGAREMKMSAEHTRDGTWSKLADGPEQVGLGTRDS